jgi:hypothetical protein
MLKRLMSIVLFFSIAGIAILTLRFKRDLFAEASKLISIYGPDLNADRTRRSWPIIEHSWVVINYDSSQIRWSHERVFNPKNKPAHIWKIVYFNADHERESEEDAFNFERGDTINERLTVTVSVHDPMKMRFK